MLYPFLDFGGFLFFIILAIELTIATCFVNSNNGTGATFTFLIGIAIFVLFGAGLGPTVLWIKDNPVEAVACVVLYGGIGAAYSVWRWYCLVREKSAIYKQQMLKIINSSYTPMPLKGTKSWMELQERKLALKHEYMPDASSSGRKGEIVATITYWPLCLVWNAVDDYVIAVFRLLGKTYENIVKSVFEKVTKEIAEVENRQHVDAQSGAAALRTNTDG